MPPSFTLGQDMFNSIAAIFADLFSTVATFSYSSIVLPATFAIRGTAYCAKNGTSVSTIFSTPGFCNPIAFNMPDAVSATLGVGLPCRSFPVAAFILTAPSLCKLYNSLYSLPKLKHPEAGITGFFIDKPGKSTDKSIIESPHLQQKPDRLDKFFYNLFLL